MLEKLELDEQWVRFLQKPREEVQKFCGFLYFFKCSEEAFKNGTQFLMVTRDGTATFDANCSITEPDEVEKMNIIDRILMFIYESVEAGYIKNPVTQLSHGEKLYKALRDFVMLQHSPQHYTADETFFIHKNYADAKKSFTGYINPHEVVMYLYETELGKEFLPKSLIKHLDSQPKLHKETKSTAPYTGTIRQSNRSGSKINPEKHAITLAACQKAWEKIQTEKILGLNAKNFSFIAGEFLKSGESLVTTISREFYKNKIPQEYKAGVGRKGK